MLIHFDLLYIGTDSYIWDLLQTIADKDDLKILNIKNTSDIGLIKDDFSFTLVISELHLSYNYEGFTVDRSGLRYSYIAILTDEITEASILVSNSLFGNQEKYLLLKHPTIINSFLKSKPGSNNTIQVPIEA